MCSSRSTIRTEGWPSRPAWRERNNAASASGSKNGLPGISKAETPPVGIRTTVGTVESTSVLAISAPIAAFSEAVVLIRVTFGLWTTKFRPENRSGTADLGPKLTMSSAPTLTTCGIPLLIAAFNRSGPAERMPPTCSSASSVVVRSSTAEISPSRINASIARPPTPVAWKTQTSNPAFSRIFLA